MRRQIESALEAHAHFVYRRAWWVIAAVGLLVAASATQIPKVEFESDAESFLHERDPVRQTYARFLEEFGRDDAMIIAVEPPEVFDLAFLEKLRRFHEELESDIPYVHDVKSLINARHTRGEGDELIVGDLFEEWPADAGALATLRARALANPLYRDIVLSRDASLTTVIVEFEAFVEPSEDDAILAGFEESAGGEAPLPRKLSADQEAEVVAGVYEVMARYETPDFRLYAAGAPVLNTDIIASMMSDVARFTGLSILVIAIVLSVVFRQITAVVVPLLVTLLSLTATVGTMGALGISFMPVSETVLSFLLSVGVGGTVHLLVIFLQRRRAGADAESALAGALSHSGLPIAMTCLTTASGLASFATAELVPIAVFGVVAPMGVLMTLASTLLLAPALMAVMPIQVRSAKALEATPSIRLLTACGRFATRHPRSLLAVCALWVLISFAGIARLQVAHNTLDWFPDDQPVKVATLKLDEEMAGSVSVEFLVDTGNENGLYDPALLRGLDEVSKSATRLELEGVAVGKSISLADVVKEIHQALNADAPSAYAVPGDRRLIAQEILLFENSGSDDLEDFVDTQFSTGRISMRVPFVDAGRYLAFGAVAKEVFEETLGERARLTMTGAMSLMGRTITAAMETMMRSYVITVSVITVLMTLLLGSIRLGLIAMLPNLFPIVVTLGLMGWLGLPLEMFSLLIGSIAPSLAVDDTIHFMHGFRNAHERSGDVERAVCETLQTTGQALLFTSIVLSLGFSIYVFSALNNLTNFGALTAFAIMMAFVADILIAPALMAWVNGTGLRDAAARGAANDGGASGPR